MYGNVVIVGCDADWCNARLNSEGHKRAFEKCVWTPGRGANGKMHRSGNRG